jgi:hypothetical protein
MVAARSDDKLMEKREVVMIVRQYRSGILKGVEEVDGIRFAGVPGVAGNQNVMPRLCKQADQDVTHRIIIEVNPLRPKRL